MAIDIMQPIRISIDLGSGLAQTPLRMQLMKGDKKANRVIVVLTDGGKEADLTGVTVSGSFIRPGDAAEIPLAGTAEGNRAIVVLDDACYAQEGYCEINVALTMGGTKRTIVALTGNVLSKGSGAYVDVSGVIPSIDDIIAQYAEMKRVTEETQEAANAATTAASKAPYVDPISKNWMIWDASAGKYVDSGVTAQGEPGPQGPPGQNGTGSGTVTGVKVEGQTYQPDGAGVVTLPKMGGGAEIDDTTPSAEKVYSSQQVENIANQLSEQVTNEKTERENAVNQLSGQIEVLQDESDTRVLKPSAAFSIPASGGSVSYNLAGLTAAHELSRWNFSSSAENEPPVDLSWHTYDGYFTITNTSGSTSETIQPVFVLPEVIAITAHS